MVRKGSANEQDSASTRDSFVSFSFDVNPWPEDIYFGKLAVDLNFRNRNSYTDNVAWTSDTKNTIDTAGFNAKYIFYAFMLLIIIFTLYIYYDVINKR